MSALPAPSKEAVVAARDLCLEAVVEMADLAASYWRSAAEAAYRGDQLTLEVHCRQIAVVTRHAFAAVKTLSGEKAEAV